MTDSHRSVDRRSGRIVYTYSFKEFMERLGIRDPEGLLRVAVSFPRDEVEVTLQPSRSRSR